MFSIRNVNLIWQKKQRGIYPPSPFALDDIGTLALASPRPLEPRSYDFTLHKADGGMEVRWGFSAETLIKMEVSHSDNCIGMTSDDLYLFHNRTKQRFLGDKHINYIDAALSEDGQRLAAAFSDLAGASFAVAFGDITGRLIWLEEFDAPLTAVAMSRDGSRVAAGLESGLLTLLDDARRTVWTFELDGPVRALACSAEGVAYALESGDVGLIKGDGARSWQTSVAGTPVAVALSDDSGLCAVLATKADGQSGSTSITCLLQDGSEGWEHDTERKSTGVSLSASGLFVAIGARDGTVALYGIVPGDESDAASADVTASILQHARVMETQGELATACEALKHALTLVPSDLAVYDELVRLKRLWHSHDLARGAAAIESGESRTAIRLASAILDDDPLSQDAAGTLRKAREARARELLAEAAALAGSDGDGAEEALLREATAVAPLEMAEPRRALAAYLLRRSADFEANADRFTREENTIAALNCLLSAQSCSPNRDRAARIRALQIEVEFEAGMAAYNSKAYVQAVFQFKKVLRLDKSHSEAQRYLEFARRFSQETTTDSLQDRFSRLE